MLSIYEPHFMYNNSQNTSNLKIITWGKKFCFWSKNLETMLTWKQLSQLLIIKKLKHLMNLEHFLNSGINIAFTPNYATNAINLQQLW